MYLDKITRDEQWRDKAGDASEEIAKSFDKSHFVDNMIEIYESVIEDMEIEESV